MAAPSAPGILTFPNLLDASLDRPRPMSGRHGSRSCAAAHRRDARRRRFPCGLFCKTPCSVRRAPRARRCNGYRCAKPQGKPNFTIGNFSLCCRHFCDFASDRTMRAFTSRSSRTLNCPSNLIGHDHPNNRPENGVGITGKFTVDRGRARGRAATIKRGVTDVSGAD
jgi:hypothetical protein